MAQLTNKIYFHYQHCQQITPIDFNQLMLFTLSVQFLNLFHHSLFVIKIITKVLLLTQIFTKLSQKMGWSIDVNYIYYYWIHIYTKCPKTMYAILIKHFHIHEICAMTGLLKINYGISKS